VTNDDEEQESDDDEAQESDNDAEQESDNEAAAKQTPEHNIIDISKTPDSDSDKASIEYLDKKMPAIEATVANNNNQDQDDNPYTLVQAKKKKAKKTQRKVTVTTPDEMASPDKMEEESTTPTTPPRLSTIDSPQTIDTKKACRYLVIVTVPPCSTEPWKAFTDLLKKFLQYIQDQTTKKLHIATWDKELEAASLIRKPRDFPDGTAKNRNTYVTYFSGYPNPQKGKESKVYLKMHFVTTSPQDMPFELEKMGQELSESIAEEMPIFLSKNPYACQAVKVECIGWFFGSTKSIDSKTIVLALKRKTPDPRSR
jgi:hypothetical protein